VLVRSRPVREAVAVLGYHALAMRDSVLVKENGVPFVPPVLKRYPLL
jgi:hypothetical protein